MDILDIVLLIFAFFLMLAGVFAVVLGFYLVLREIKKEKEVERIEASKTDASADAEEDESRHDIEKR